MTRIFDNPDLFIDDVLRGFCAAHPQLVVPVPGGVVRAQETRPGKVAVLVGGGSGHYPAFFGIVGPGFADGAIVGNVFTSPSAKDAISVAQAAENGGGVIITSGNYAGDVLHFSEAAHLLSEQGIPTETLFVTDDLASAPRGHETTRRGIAGGFAIFKVLSAAAEAGHPLAEVLRLGTKANDQTRTLGVAFAGCTLPGGEEPLFTVPEGKMAVGLGIHGEAGISEEDIPSARELAKRLVDETLQELPLEKGAKVGVILNGLGGTKYEELFVLWASIHEFLEDRGLEIVDPEIGELVTSLDMAGLSLTIVALDDELEPLWRAPAHTPAFTKGALSEVQASGPQRSVHAASAVVAETFAPVTPKSQSVAAKILELLQVMEATILPAEAELGRIDAVAGDGDHGRGMVKGIKAAVEGAQSAFTHGAGARQTLEHAGEAWSAKAGGTSGALWGAALTAMGQHFPDDAKTREDTDVLAAVTEAKDAIIRLGKAQMGDKTMVDALVPFVESLRQGLEQGDPLPQAWVSAATAATTAAEETAALRPKIGRARPLAERSVGTPDAGATSLALILVAVGHNLDGR